MAPRRILYVNGGILDRGGITAYMMNYYRHFDKDLLQVDFIAHGGEGAADREILENGGRIYHVPTKRQDLFGNVRELNRIFSSGEYKLIHAHMDGMNGMILKMAQRCGIPIRISHSHSTNYLTKNRLKIALHERVRRQIPKYATHLWACSQAAGRWLYGEQAEFTVIPNAIDVERWRFRPEMRQEQRDRHHLNDKFVIGHVGWLNYPKNQEFLIDLMPDLLKRRPDAMLVLVGEGPNRSKLERMIRERNLQEQVLMLGERGDVSDLINMFDVFTLPSEFEGFPVSAIEAQANGAACMFSDRVPAEVKVTDCVCFLPLEKEAWIEALSRGLVTKSDHVDRMNAAETIRKKGYDIFQAAEDLQKRYMELV